jgi:hypothetical protein
VSLLCNESDLGFTRPLNRGLQAARGDFLVSLNPDTLVHAGAFDMLIAFMQAHPEVGLASPKVLNADGTLQMQCRRGEARPGEVLGYFLRLDRIFPDHPVLAGYLLRYLPEDEIAEVKAISGSCMIIRRAVINSIGFFDERFFAYQEDADYSFRARQAGWKVFYVPGAEVTHFGGKGGSGHRPMRNIIQWHRSYFLYYRKHLAKDYFFLFNYVYYGLMFGKLLVALTASLFRRNKIVGTRKPE